MDEFVRRFLQAVPSGWFCCRVSAASPVLGGFSCALLHVDLTFNLVSGLFALLRAKLSSLYELVLASIDVPPPSASFASLFGCVREAGGMEAQGI